jgi:hypothetical protein
MQAVKQLPPLAEILSYDRHYSAELALEIHAIARPLVIWQEVPTVAIETFSGVFLPPHERLMIDLAHRGAQHNVFVGSRGTSKTSAIAVLYCNYKLLMFAKRAAITLQASGFRGGQLIFNDFERYAQSGWVDQEAGLKFIEASLKGDKLVKRAQNYWAIQYTSLSSNITVPTTDSEKLRGMRGTELNLDEANFAEVDLVDKVSDSFLNVKQDMRTGGDNARDNVVYYTSTLDYTWRPFYSTVRSAYETLRRELEYLTLLKTNPLAAKKLSKKGFHEMTVTYFDYVDCLIPRYITNREGQEFEIKWPDKSRKFRWDDGIPFTVVDEEGRLKREGEPLEILSTYPINRSIEGKLVRGDTSEEIWLSEQRNVTDSSAGDVYTHAMVDEAVSKGNRFLIPWADCSPAYKKIYPEPERHYAPTVMWSCSDPCVLGVDYAPGSRDFSALVVIRMGPLAKGEFDPATGLGHTAWSNVIWAEQHRNASGANVAEKIRQYADRFNLTYFFDPHETDIWKVCRAIGLDTRGGGNTVRDELVLINHEEVPAGLYRIVDPLDDDPRLAAYKTDTSARQMLDAIKPTGVLNDKLVEFTVGQLQSHLLYLPKDIPHSERRLDAKVDVAFDGVRILEHQLRALQQAPTASGYRTFFMAGDSEDVTNKKDMWAAFIYASKQLRAHLLRWRLIQDTPPPMGARLVHVGGGKNAGRAHGSKRW